MGSVRLVLMKQPWGTSHGVPGVSYVQMKPSAEPAPPRLGRLRFFAEEELGWACFSWRRQKVVVVCPGSSMGDTRVRFIRNPGRKERGKKIKSTETAWDVRVRISASKAWCLWWAGKGKESPKCRGLGPIFIGAFLDVFTVDLMGCIGFLVAMKKAVKIASSPEQPWSSSCNPGGKKKKKKKIIKSADCMENAKIIPVEWRWWGNAPWALWGF